VSIQALFSELSTPVDALRPPPFISLGYQPLSQGCGYPDHINLWRLPLCFDPVRYLSVQSPPAQAPSVGSLGELCFMFLIIPIEQRPLVNIELDYSDAVEPWIERANLRTNLRAK